MLPFRDVSGSRLFAARRCTLERRRPRPHMSCLWGMFLLLEDLGRAPAVRSKHGSRVWSGAGGGDRDEGQGCWGGTSSVAASAAAGLGGAGGGTSACMVSWLPFQSPLRQALVLL